MRVRVLFTQRRGMISICWMSLISISTIRPDWRKRARLSDASVSPKASIHLKQIPVINEVFFLTPELVERARRILAEFEKDETGLVVVDGELIERPVIRSMLRVLAIADHLENAG